MKPKQKIYHLCTVRNLSNEATYARCLGYRKLMKQGTSKSSRTLIDKVLRHIEAKHRGDINAVTLRTDRAVILCE
jgi:hypothetical protein